MKPLVALCMDSLGVKAFELPSSIDHERGSLACPFRPPFRCLSIPNPLRMLLPCHSYNVKRTVVGAGGGTLDCSRYVLSIKQVDLYKVNVGVCNTHHYRSCCEQGGDDIMGIARNLSAIAGQELVSNAC